MKKISNFFDRMLKIAEINGIDGVTELQKALGYKSAEKLYRLNRQGNSPSFDIILDLTNKFENMNVRWLLIGEGEPMLLTATDLSVVSEPEDVFLKVNRQIRELDEGKSNPEAEQLNGEILRLKFENEVLRSALREIGAERNDRLEELDRRTSEIEKLMKEVIEFRNAYVHAQPLKKKSHD